MARIKTSVGPGTALLAGGDGTWQKIPDFKSFDLRYNPGKHFEDAVELSKWLGIDPPESDSLEDLHKFDRKAVPLLNEKRMMEMEIRRKMSFPDSQEI